MNKNIFQNWTAVNEADLAFTISNEDDYIIEGNNFKIDGNHIVAHLLRIHNCNRIIIRNLRFINGNTNTLKKIPKEKIGFSNKFVSIFEVIDGGAVLITGNSNVIFESCHFEGNESFMCGGAISNQSKGTVTVDSCTFTNNVAGHTGSAIDNLVRNAHLIVKNSIFQNNKSNAWHNVGYPHGQISVFPNTKAEIYNTYFSGGSIPIDYMQSSNVSLKENTYIGFENWSESNTFHRRAKFADYVKFIKKMYWVLLKTFGRVYYRVN